MAAGYDDGIQRMVDHFDKGINNIKGSALNRLTLTEKVLT